MKKFIGKVLWIVLLGATFLLGVLLFLLLSLVFGGFYIPFSLSMLLFLSVIGYSLIKRESTYQGYYGGYFEVSQKHEAIVEIAGSYIGNPLKAGWYFIFPLFKLVFVKAVLFMGDDEIELFDRGGDDKVDFSDGASAKLEARVYIRIINSYNAIYSVANFRSAIRDKIESALRHYCGSRSLDDVNRNKGKISLDDPCIKDLVQGIYEKWGVSIFNLTISDIELSDEDIKIRKQKMEKMIEKEIASLEKDRAIILAEGEAETVKISGAALADKVKSLAGAGVDEKVVIAYLEAELKWTNIGDKTIIIDDGQGIGGIIARLQALGTISIGK